VVKDTYHYYTVLAGSCLAVWVQW